MDTTYKGLQLLEEVGSATAATQSPRAFIVGGGVLLVAFLIGVLLEFRTFLSGGQPTWSTPILRLIAFSFLLGSYAVIASSLVTLVKSFGDLSATPALSEGTNILVARSNAFSGYVQKQVESGSWLSSVGSAFVEQQISTLVFVSYSFAAAVIYVLKIIQKVMLATLLQLGPIMIGFAAIPGLTSRYLTAWFLSVIEVSSWGVIALTLRRLMGASLDPTRIKPELTPNLVEHIAFNLLFALAFALIPVIAASILRGGGAAGIAAAPLAVGKLAAFKAGGFLAGAANRARATGAGAAAGAAGAAAGRAGAAAGAGSVATTRAGDAAADRRAAFARDGAIRKQERERSGDS